MKLAMVGLGKMGGNMVCRLAKAGHDVVAYDLSPEMGEGLAAKYESVQAATSLSQMIEMLPSPACIWMMVPHQFVDDTIKSVIDAGLRQGDLLIDGGNSNYKESQRRGAELEKDGYLYVDAGTSGGVWGLQNGYSLMVGGSDKAIELLEPALKSLAPGEDKGWGHVGPVGAGHFTKMVHNGIEYGMMQAYAEGYELIKAKEEFNVDLHQLSKIWQHGSVIQSWLLDLTTDALSDDPELSKLSDWVDDSGEGRWTVNESIDSAVPTPVLTLALMMRFRSRQDSSFAGRLLSAMRAGFGGHAVKKS
jgi:6-phosphogluconate dehydrogenase